MDRIIVIVFGVLSLWIGGSIFIMAIGFEDIGRLSLIVSSFIIFIIIMINGLALIIKGIN